MNSSAERSDEHNIELSHMENCSKRSSTDISASVSINSQVKNINNNNNKGKIKGGFLKKFAFSKRQWTYLGLFGLANVFRGITVLIAGPFYPPEAEKKGVADSQLGFIFASYDFSTFLFSLIFGKFIIPKLGPRLVYKLSTLNIGISTVLFGLLALIDDHKLFLGLSFAIRIIAGAGDAGNYPSAFTIFAHEFPDDLSTMIGLFEFAFGIGAILGPVVFGAVIDSIGFLAVYVIAGSLLIATALLIHFFAPDPLPEVLGSCEMVLDKTSDRIQNPKWWRVFLMPELLVVVLNLFTTASSIGFVTATLEGHLDKFSLTSFQVGAVFIISSVIYTILTPVWGLIGDKLVNNKHLIIIVGSTLIGAGFSFLGPLPFFTSEAVLWTTLLGLALHGIGMGGAVMSAFPHAVQVVTKNGFPDNEATYSLISSLYTLTFTFGNAFGPSISGVLVEEFKFQWATLFIIGLVLITVLSSLIFLLMKSRRSTK